MISDAQNLIGTSALTNSHDTSHSSDTESDTTRQALSRPSASLDKVLERRVCSEPDRRVGALTHHDREQTTVDTPETFFAHDGCCAGNKSFGVPWYCALSVID